MRTVTMTGKLRAPAWRKTRGRSGRWDVRLNVIYDCVCRRASSESSSSVENCVNAAKAEVAGALEDESVVRPGASENSLSGRSLFYAARKDCCKEVSPCKGVT